MCGVYKIANKINGKIYVGSAKDFSERWNRHLRQLRKGKHHSKHLQRAYDKYGEDNFSFEIIEICSEEQRLEREQYYLDALLPFGDRGYNESKKATNCVLYGENNGMYGKRGENNPNFGRRNTEETKRKMSMAAKGKKKTESSKRKLSETRKKLFKEGKLQPYRPQWSKEDKERLSKEHSKSLLQIDKNTGEILHEFKNAIEAEEITGINKESIYKACQGKSKTSGGFAWKYKE